jgi:Ca-activated chloride channel family protein
MMLGAAPSAVTSSEQEEEEEGYRLLSPASKEKKQLYDQALSALRSGDKEGYQAGRVGVGLSVDMEKLRTQDHVDQATTKRVANCEFVLESGKWVDQRFHNAKRNHVNIKPMSNAYFRILERHPEMKEVFQLGNQLVWVTPSDDLLVIDARIGQEELTDAEIDRLFESKK